VKINCSYNSKINSKCGEHYTVSMNVISVYVRVCTVYGTYVRSSGHKSDSTQHKIEVIASIADNLSVSDFK
jgi:hypothetical protein